MKCRKKTASLRISLSLLAVLLLIMNCAAFTACSLASDDGVTSAPTQPQTPSEQEPPTNKITYYYYSGSTMLSTADASIFEANVAAEDAVEVAFNLNYIIPECNCKEQINKNSTREKIDAIMQAHRDKLKEFHLTQNNRFVEDNGLSALQGDCRLTISEYSPYVCLLVDSYAEYQHLEDQILVCADSTVVSNVSVSIPLEYKSSAVRREDDDAPLYSLSQAISDINVSDQIYDGSEVPIGIIEAHGVTASNVDTELNHLTIKPHGETNLSDHAETVTRILCGSNGVAPGVENVYISGCPYSVDIIWSIEFMIGYNVSLINISMRPGAIIGEYHWTSGLLDYYAAFYFLTFVVSAGNNGDVEDYSDVNSYAMGYNVVSVGALDADNTISTYSSYGADYGLGVRKPTVSAPGTNIYLTGETASSGTSWSAPMVTGVIARLTEEYPFLSAYPEAVAPILAVSATPVNGQGNNWDEHAGAGRVNYEKAREATEHFWDFCFSNDDLGVRVIRNITVDADKRLKVAIGWFTNSRTESSVHTVLARQHTDYDIFLTDAYGNQINGAESSSNTNIEYINFENGSYNVININLGQYTTKETTYPDRGVITWVCE